MAFDSPLAEEIWSGKYRFAAPDGSGDSSLGATWDRVAAALAEAEAPKVRARWRGLFRDALEDFRFLPAGRIVAGAGTGRNVTLFNCFVMGTVPDSLDGIFQHVREAAVTMQQGGGVGMDFSTVRPSGAAVLGVGAEASGPLSFMDVWDSMCRTIMSAGQRRGAMMGCLRIDHPDIEAFIDAKRDPARLRNFNLSVLVPDSFMKALEANADWPLTFAGQTFRQVPARELWARLMQATYDCAEPGVIFIDRVNARNNLAWCETISASNPCGEQMLPPYGACLLGSINLAKLVAAPFSPDAEIDEAALGELTRAAVRMLDNVIDISRYPLPAQEEEARAKRRIGLGVTGLADALIFCGVRYGREAAAQRTRDWLGLIRREAYRASAELAREKGPFPLYDARMLNQPNLIALDDDRALIAGVGEDGKLVHVWNAARNQIEASFFTPAEHVTNTMAAAFMNFVQIARRADTVAVVFSISDSIFFYTLQGQHIRTIPLPSPSFRVIGPETPDAVRLDATARRDWMGTFDLTSHINWLGDGTLVVMWKRLDPAEALAPSWHAVHLTPGGRLLSETATPQFLAFDPRTDSLYFVAPSAEVPNQWIAAYLQ